MSNIMLGKAAKNKLYQILLSNDTISNRTDDMSDDILAQVIAPAPDQAQVMSNLS